MQKDASQDRKRPRRGCKVKETTVLLPEEYNRVYREYSEKGMNLNDLMAQMHTDLIRKALAGIEYKKQR